LGTWKLVPVSSRDIFLSHYDQTGDMHPPRANARVRRCRSPIYTYPFHLDARRILVWLAIISDLLLIDYQLLWDISKQEAKIQSYFVFVLEIIGQTAT
jgi:hypothetical protein